MKMLFLSVALLFFLSATSTNSPEKQSRDTPPVPMKLQRKRKPIGYYISDFESVEGDKSKKWRFKSAKDLFDSKKESTREIENSFEKLTF